jgi:hypothetical protein
MKDSRSVALRRPTVEGEAAGCTRRLRPGRPLTVGERGAPAVHAHDLALGYRGGQDSGGGIVLVERGTLSQFLRLSRESVNGVPPLAHGLEHGFWSSSDLRGGSH